MDDQTGGPRAPEGASDLQQRQAALRALAQNQQTQPSQTQRHNADVTPPHLSAPATHAATPSRARRPRALAVGGATLIIVALVVAAIVGVNLKQHGGSSTAPTSVAALNVQRMGLKCISYAAWSPDSAHIALLGDVQGCGSSTATDQTAAIYLLDAQTHKVLAQYQPDALIFSSPTVVRLSGGTSVQLDSDQLFYESLIWTPDSQSLLMSFSVVTPVLQDQQNVQLIGLLRLGISQKALNSVWVEQQPSSQDSSLTRVDLTSGAIAQIPVPASAIAYSWNSDGTLSPVAAASAANAPIGSPVGGATFSIWQPGILLFGRSEQASSVQPTLDTHEIRWSAPLTPLSPDGRYCYLGIPSYVSVIPPTTQQASAGFPSAAPRDQALLALAKQMLTTASPNLFTRTLVSWRPDGRYLAATNENLTRGGSAATTVTVSIYDTTTGKLVSRLTPNFAGMQPSQTGFDSLSWSPDGKHLLLADNVYGALTIWGPAQLPS